mmetsp:Transcript_1791/g.4192  ORF Transcript_1791/g.4192 Transcript_1791/m.4192 type:complete len:256 (+) Transcript_1791:241-1008(+)
MLERLPQPVTIFAIPRIPSRLSQPVTLFAVILIPSIPLFPLILSFLCLLFLPLLPFLFLPGLRLLSRIRDWRSWYCLQHPLPALIAVRLGHVLLPLKLPELLRLCDDARTFSLLHGVFLLEGLDDSANAFAGARHRSWRSFRLILWRACACWRRVSPLTCRHLFQNWGCELLGNAERHLRDLLLLHLALLVGVGIGHRPELGLHLHEALHPAIEDLRGVPALGQWTLGDDAVLVLVAHIGKGLPRFIAHVHRAHR